MRRNPEYCRALPRSLYWLRWATLVQLAAHGQTTHFRHYKLIDMGTFGGPVSSINGPFFEGTLNSRGVTVGWSATSAPTSPTSSFLVCGGLDAVVPFITHAFEWERGVVTDLGSLAGADYCSEPFFVNAQGEIVGASEKR